ncbi:MAG: hypothetical protein WCK35_05575 [Chloroflexota bacterium]
MGAQFLRLTFSKQKAQVMTWAFYYLMPNVSNSLKISYRGNGRRYRKCGDLAVGTRSDAESANGTADPKARAKAPHLSGAPAQAMVATAALAIARVVYQMLKYKVEYDPPSVNEYQKQYGERQIKYMKK